METKLTVLQPGQEVQVSGSIKARLLAVAFDGHHVTYRCVWWDGNSRSDMWLERSEVEAAPGADATTIKIGFGR